MVAVIAGIFGLALAFSILYLLRRDHLHIGHGVGWALAIVLFSSLGAMPWIADQLALKLKVGYPPIITVMLGFGALTIKLLLVDIERTKMEIRHRRLAQKVAILEADLRELNQKSKIED